jgi:hypothetical protein
MDTELLIVVLRKRMCLGVTESVDSCWFLVPAVIIYLKMHLTRNRYQVAPLPLERSLAVGYMENRKIGL